jgi:hypothetical protein
LKARAPGTRQVRDQAPREPRGALPRLGRGRWSAAASLTISSSALSRLRGITGRPTWVANDEVLVLPSGSGEEALLGLLPAAPRQSPHGVAVQRYDSARALVLGLRPHRTPTHCDKPLVDAECLVGRVEVVPSQRKGLRTSEAVQHAKAKGDRPAVVRTRGQERGHLLRPGVDSALLWRLATERGIGTRAAGLRRNKPSSTASANAARRTVRQIWIDRHDSRPAPAISSSQRAMSSRSRRSSRIVPNPDSMCGSAQAYCSRAFNVTSQRAAT